jgi:hypothetical protein
VVSLEEWERLAPLDDGQLQSINVVKEKYSEREYPENVRQQVVNRRLMVVVPSRDFCARSFEGCFA